jgi:hypothetical protein
MTENTKTRQRVKRSATTGSLVAGFVHGLAQMGSLGSVSAMVNYPKPRSSDAMQGDWQRVGADMKRGFEKVRNSEKAKT